MRMCFRPLKFRLHQPKFSLIHNSPLKGQKATRSGYVFRAEQGDISGRNLQVRVVCSSPDGVLLLAIDEDGRCLLINKPRQALLHRFSFRGPVGAAKFSPDGRFIACGVGKILQVGVPSNMLLSWLALLHWHYERLQHVTTLA